jgi:hypothetical protein
MSNSFTTPDLTWIRVPDSDIKATHSYAMVMHTIQSIKTSRAEYKYFYERYGAKQADYNRRAAMIRQKPELHITINRQQVLDTIMQWDNVWGADSYVSQTDDSLYIRIGLCDIVMSESASESYYDEPMGIMLAPFYITVRLTKTGGAIVPSRDGNTRGLSRGNPGCVSYDIHPHQLSDQPCFGTFGQTLVDLANNGDLISYIGTIIAFYSQYNSQDSAGVSARLYHPSYFPIWENEEHYISRLMDGMRGLNTHMQLNYEKFNAALERYRYLPRRM